MKKTIQLCALIVTSALFANDNSFKEKALKELVSTTQCCTQTASNGVKGAGHLSITINKCVTVENTDNTAAVKAAACDRALIAAQNAVKALSDATFIIH
ncbi:MAG: hypothetical protein ACOVLC_14290 [Flavobacterium sp.]|jgi:hypothetical protein